jgi:hypothetical protein
MTARALIVCEGVHDLNAYGTIAELVDRERGIAPPEAYGVRIISAGVTDGGIDKVPRMAELARGLGFRVVALVDFDADAAQAAARLAAIQSAADAVVRLPVKHAIEQALLAGISDGEIVTALLQLSSEFALPLPTGWETTTGADLHMTAAKALKSNNGLHSQFLFALPTSRPQLGIDALAAAVDCATGVRPDVHVQL